MKRCTKIILSIAILMAFISTSLGLTTIAVKSIRINTTSIKLSVGNTYKLKVTVIPENATNKKFTFSSANKKIASVDKDGNIKGIIPGKTVVTVTSVSNKKAVAKCNVTILRGLSFPLKKEVNLSIMTRIQLYPGSMDLPVYKKMKELTNVSFTFEDIPEANYVSIASTRLASGLNLPDIIRSPGAQVVQKLIDADLVYQITNDSLQKYAPGLSEYFAQNPSDKTYMYFPDGKMWLMPTAIVETKVMTQGAAINNNIIKKLGLKMPTRATTPDELYNMLIAMKKGGIKYPLTQRAGFENIVFEWFGIKSRTYSFWAYDNKVDYLFTRPEYKNALIFLNKLYQEDLLDKEFSKQDMDVIQPKLDAGQVGIFLGHKSMPWSQNPKSVKDINDPNNVNNMEWLPLPPLNNQNVTEYYPFGFGYLISKTCKNPDVAMMILDFWLTNKEAFYFYYLGVEGVSYEIDEKGIAKKLLPDSEIYGRIGANNGMPFQQNYQFLSQNAWPQDPMSKKHTQLCIDYSKYIVKPYPKPTFNQAEGDVFNKYITDISTYALESRYQFIKGEKPMSEWDKYVERIKELGIDKVLKVEQSRYDRAMSSK